MNFLTVSSLLAICGLAAAGHLYDNHHGGHATSYAVVTKHEPSKHGWEHKDWEHHNEGHHWDGAKVNHYDDHHYDDHHYDNKHAKYEFDYGVKDLKTGDIKNQWEHRDGDHVKGSYSLKEADGTTRVVEYTADDHNGFNAVVKKIGHAHHPEMVYSKPHYYGGWEADNSHHGYNHGYAHGHATSYVNVKTY